MVKLFGTQDTFQIGFAERAPNNLEASSENAWLLGSIWVANEKVWGDKTTSFPDFEWTWAEFLNGLAGSWPWLLFEDTYPIPLRKKPDNPGQLTALAQERWRTLPKSTRSEEKEKVFSFKLRHNLSMFMRGVFMHELWVLPEGTFYCVWSAQINKGITVPRNTLIKTLADAGDYLCRFFENSTDGFARRSSEKWKSRSQKVEEHYLQILSSMSEKSLIEISGSKENIAPFFGIKPSNDPLYEYENNCYLAAARMSSGFISESTRKTLMEYIRETEDAADNGIIDNLSEKVLAAMTDDDEPHHQGYAAARKLREALGLSQTDKFDVENFLSNQGIRVHDICLADALNLEALAMWGKCSSPHIFINIAEGTRSSTQSGRRATLAHEVCHILCDREGALPLVEVFGSYNISARIEKRARAFAAELLAPAEGIKTIINGFKSLMDALPEITRQYGASREIICWQIINNTIPLSPVEIDYLKNWAGITG